MLSEHRIRRMLSAWADGTVTGGTGWQVRIQSFSNSSTVTVTVYVVCG